MEPTAIEPHTLSSEEVRFSIHYKSACVVEFDAEALPLLVKEARRQAIRRVAKEVTLPGFRKGRAPDEMVVSGYPQQIDKEWQQSIGELTFRACEKLARIPLLHREGKATFKMKSHSQEGALLTLSFETEPTLPEVDPKEFQLKAVKRPEVNDQKIDETIRQIQLFFAEWKTIDDRPIEMGDFVLLDVDVIEETPSTPLFSHTRFEVTEQSMAQWMRDLVLGKKTGDVVEGTSIPDPDASQEDQESLKPKKVQITIKAMDQATLPPLDDEFTKKVGVQTVDELRENITQLLNRQADAHVQEALREQASTFMLSHYTFELPASLIETEAQFRLKQLAADPDFMKYWNSLGKEERKQTLTSIYQQSEKAVRMHYLCRKIIADAKIHISAQDVPPPAFSPLEFLLEPQKLFHHQKNPETEHAEALSRLMLEKAEDYLIANASQEESPTSTPKDL